MDQPSHNVVRLESGRKYHVFRVAILLFVAGMVAVFGCVLLRGGGRAAPVNWQSILVGLLFIVGAGFVSTLAKSDLRKIQVPDVLEFSPDVFGYVSVADHKNVSAPWSLIRAPEKRFVGKSYSLAVEIAGQSLLFDDGQFGMSIETLMGMINSAREGRIVTVAQRLADCPEPNDAGGKLVAMGAGVVGVLLFLAIILTALPLRH